MDKNVGIRLAAFALLLWYCISIIGFDVHTCSGSGQTFIATFVNGLDCKDIHSFSPCCSASSDCKECCCHNSHKSGLSEEDCCTDDYLAISLTGTNDGNDSSKMLVAPSSSLCRTVSAVADLCILPVFRNRKIPESSGSLKLPDIRTLAGIWRI